MLRRTALSADLIQLPTVIQPQCAWISEMISRTLSAEQSHSSSGTCHPRPPTSCRPFVTSHAAPASGMGGTGSSTVDIFDRCALHGRIMWVIRLAAVAMVTWSTDNLSTPFCRDVKRAHRERAVRLQTSEDPLQVSQITSPQHSTEHADYLYYSLSASLCRTMCDGQSCTLVKKQPCWHCTLCQPLLQLWSSKSVNFD